MLRLKNGERIEYEKIVTHHFIGDLYVISGYVYTIQCYDPQNLIYYIIDSAPAGEYLNLLIKKHLKDYAVSEYNGN